MSRELRLVKTFELSRRKIHCLRDDVGKNYELCLLTDKFYD